MTLGWFGLFRFVAERAEAIMPGWKTILENK
jgi:hypothetical protein